ncbi:unnamed protein product, partial [marine sediment metagenome]
CALPVRGSKAMLKGPVVTFTWWYRLNHIDGLNAKVNSNGVALAKFTPQYLG